MKSNSRKIMAFVVLASFCVFVGCVTGPQPVKQYELGKVTAETILYEARVMQNHGAITVDQFNQIRDIYDQLRQAQDIAIDARKAVIAYNTTDNQNKFTVAMNNVLALSIRMVTLAQNIGLMKGGI